ncbi:hypothetical protein OCOL_001390 [Ordospora colligata]|uniref:Pre-mRNA splicing helicase n=1 Tax=Ordospora colligata OC4 TaxID=1354746 RepID=A0A0B2UKQ8_9MICR|nr:pre-mRNA splicing helicase [Ordospora colligata OC4]KHN69590.1 pre-mRNA splicing helicase [Ordospora colligata OC4]TBU15510.1 pre-mRNA splicing helicase [Ordospora colligata]
MYISYAEYVNMIANMVGESDEYKLEKIVGILLSCDASGEQLCHKIEEVVEKRLALDVADGLAKITQSFCGSDRSSVLFEDVELFDALFAGEEKRMLLEVIRSEVFDKLYVVLKGWKMYFLNRILCNSKAFEYFLVYQLEPEQSMKAKEMLRTEGVVAFTKYIEHDALSQMSGSKIVDLERTSSNASTHVKKRDYPIDAEVKYADGIETVYVRGGKKDVDFDNRVPEDVKLFFEEGFKFNYVQSVVYDAVINDSGNILVCAPTGSGKTIIGALSIFKVVMKRRKMDDGKNVDAEHKNKIGYVVPMRALAREISITLGRMFSRHGMRVVEHTSDTDVGYKHLDKADVIVCTPEKLDALTRNTGFRFEVLVIDEIHMLDEDRGATIEALVARMSIRNGCRIIGLSATLPNHTDVGRFLKCREQNMFLFGNEFRRCAMDYELINVGMREMEKSIVIEKVLESMEVDGPVLVFVHSRKEVVEMANELRRYLQGHECKDVDDELLVDAQGFIREIVRHRIGIHHAGLSRKIRTAMEELYKNGRIDVMVCTSTLAWGVNLPGRTVIIKGADVYDTDMCEWKSIRQTEILQMFGRAGRFGDERCKGILVSSKQTEFLVERCIESRLLPRLCDFLNAEIASGMRKFSEATDWFKHTFYYARLVMMNRESGKVARELVYSALKHLEAEGLIVFDPFMHSTCIGTVASRYCLSYRDSSRMFAGLCSLMTDSSMLSMIAKMNEFKGINAHKREFDIEDVENMVPIPTESTFGILVQCYVANRIESTVLSQNLPRMLAALFETSVRKKLGVCRRVIRWYKTVVHRIFPYQTPLRHFCTDYEALKMLEMKEIPFSMLEVLGREGLTEIGISTDVMDNLKYVPRFYVSSSVYMCNDGYYVINIGIEKTFDDSKCSEDRYYILMTDSRDRDLVVCDTIVFGNGVYVSQNYAVNTRSPFLNIYVLSANYLCPEDPSVLSLVKASSVGSSMFSSVWKELIIDTLSKSHGNVVKLGLSDGLICTKAVIVSEYRERRRLRMMGYDAYVYDEFVSRRVVCESVTIMDVHNIFSNHLIETCIAQCIIQGIRMILVGLPFADGADIEYLGNIEQYEEVNNSEYNEKHHVQYRKEESTKISVYGSSSLTYHGEIQDYLNEFELNTNNMSNDASCLVIVPVQSSCKYFINRFRNAKIAVEFACIGRGVYLATRRSIDMWISAGWNPCVDQIHVIGTVYYDHESQMYTDYKVADVYRYSMLGSRVFIYTKQSKALLYLKDGKVPMYYRSSGRAELGLYAYWIGCSLSKYMICTPLLVEEEGLTRYGQILCKYGVCIDTIRMFIDNVKDKMGLKNILLLVCRAEELMLCMDHDEYKTLSSIGVDVSKGKAHGLACYDFVNEHQCLEVLQYYVDCVLPIIYRMYLCLLEVSLEKMYLKTAFNVMFGLQGITKKICMIQDKFYKSKIVGDHVVVEVMHMPDAPVGFVIFFLFSGSNESEILKIESPGVYNVEWKSKVCYVVNDYFGGFDTIDCELIDGNASV